MKEIIEIVERFWLLLTVIGGGIGGWIKWRFDQKAKKQTSTQMLYDQLEKLKQKVILQVHKEVAQATEIAEKNRIIEEFKNACPDCYNSLMKIYPDDGSAD